MQINVVTLLFKQLLPLPDFGDVLVFSKLLRRSCKLQWKHLYGPACLCCLWNRVRIPTVLDQKTGGNKTQKPPLNTEQVEYILRGIISTWYIWLTHQKGPYTELWHPGDPTQEFQLCNAFWLSSQLKTDIFKTYFTAKTGRFVVVRTKVISRFRSLCNHTF